jgi:hypothetical protein
MKNCFKFKCEECSEPDFSECEAFQEKVLKELEAQNKIHLNILNIETDRS